jgi:hypothetical protein
VNPCKKRETTLYVKSEVLIFVVVPGRFPLVKDSSSIFSPHRVRAAKKNPTHGIHYHAIAKDTGIFASIRDLSKWLKMEKRLQFI